MQNSRKQALRDVFKVAVSNIIALICGILVGFVIPKIMGFDDYGYFKTYSLYAGYTGLLHFGISDGIFFYFSGADLKTLDKRKIHSLVSFVIALEAIISIIGITVSLFFTSGNPYGLIFIFVFLYSFFSHVQTVLAYVCQATKQFSFPSLISSLKSLADILAVVVLLVLYKTQDSFVVSFELYCAVLVSILAVSSLAFVIKLWSIVFSKGQRLDQTRSDIALMLKLGFPIMIANLTSSLIMTVDKQFVSIFYPVEASNVFAEFSFAYSVLGLITAVTGAVSMVLFPYMKGKDEKRLCEIFPHLNAFLVVFVSFACSSYFGIQWIVDKFINKYADSLVYMRVILPGFIINASVTVLMHNYYKTLNKEHVYFWQNIVILFLAVITDLLAYYFIVLPLDRSNPIWLTVASDFTLLIWYIVSEGYLVKHYQIKHWKNDLYCIVASGAFLAVAFFLNEWMGFVVYFVGITILSLCFYGNDLRAFVAGLSKRKKHKKQD